MAWQNAGLAIAEGLAGASGDEATAARAQADIERNRQIHQNELNLQMAPLLQSIAADQQRLSTLAPNSPEHDAILNNMALSIGKVRNLNGDKTPAEDPSRLATTINGIRQHLHLGGKTDEQLAAEQSGKVNNWYGQNRTMAGEYENAALPFAMTSAGQLEAKKAADAQALAEVRGTMREYQSPDGKERNWFRPGNEPSGWQAMASGGKGYIRQGSHVLLPSDAISLMTNSGETFQKQDGTPWTADEISKFPKGIILAQFIEGDKTFYAPMDQRTKTASWGNVVHQISEAGNITQDNSTPLGPQRVGTTTTQTAPGGSQVITQTSIPNTVGSAAPPRRSTTPSGPIHRRLQGHAAASRGESILPDIQNMTPRNAEMARKTQPAVTALLGLYGDPQNPKAPSMIEFAPLANDPHAQLVLGEAFKLLDQQMGEISDPGIIQTLATSGGWANFRGQAEASAQQATGTQMTPQEREYFDSAIASMADIIGSRAATGQSPARFSVRSIQNELPLIGLSGTPDEESYLTKMQTIGRQVRVGLNAMPDNSRAMAWLTTQENKIAAQKEQKQRKPIVQFHVGQKVKLKNGNTITIKHVYPDGSFD